jgi:putative FmdB family regulatory protein
VPLYEYKCLKCGRRTEKIEGVTGPHLKKCPDCSGKVEAVITAPSFQFKGAGWYVTDYASKSGGSDGDKPAAETKDGAAKETPAKESGTKDAPAKETSAKEKKSTKKR